MTGVQTCALPILRLVIATLNLLLQERLPQPKSRESLPSLSILIPARNEAHNIEALLSDLTHVESECLIEIIVCDDASEDSTAELVETWMQRDSRIRLRPAIMMRSEGCQPDVISSSLV